MKDKIVIDCNLDTFNIYDFKNSLAQMSIDELKNKRVELNQQINNMVFNPNLLIALEAIHSTILERELQQPLRKGLKK